MTEPVTPRARLRAALAGGELNVVRTVREYEAAGVAAIHLEDQAFPKKCGHLPDKELIGADEFVLKLRAALDARTDPDLVVIARTDARGPLGLDAAIDRANTYADAGADVIFVEAAPGPASSSPTSASSGCSTSAGTASATR